MAVRQISVFIDNKPGRLAAVTALLAENNIDMRALSLADSSDYGILRILVDDTEKVQSLLTAGGYISKINHVLAVSVDDTPGGLAKVVQLLGDNDVNIEYMYAFVLPGSKTACVVIRVRDNRRVEAMLTDKGIVFIGEDEINAI